MPDTPIKHEVHADEIEPELSREGKLEEALKRLIILWEKDHYQSVSKGWTHKDIETAKALLKERGGEA